MPRSYRFPVLATSVCSVCVLILIGLGVWQVQRLAWKTELQRQYDVLLAQTHVSPLTEDDFSLNDGQVAARGELIGHFLFSKAQYLNGFVAGGRTQFPVMVPVQLDHSAQYVVAVLWVMDRNDPHKWESVRDRDWRVTGLIRRAETPSIFRPKNVATKGEWWSVTPQELADFWGLSPVSPTVFYAQNAAALDEDEQPYPLDTHLRNDHFQYAIFWFTMALVLTGIWGLRFLRPYLHSA